jgi:hypothetical protein
MNGASNAETIQHITDKQIIIKPNGAKLLFNALIAFQKVPVRFSLDASRPSASILPINVAMRIDMAVWLASCGTLS